VDEWSSAFRNQLGEELADAKQEALLEFTRALQAGRYRGEGPLEAFVARIVRFRCIDRLRAASAQQSERVDMDLLPSAGRLAYARLIQRESEADLWRLFAEMPLVCQELWSLLLEGLSYAEMGQRLDVREGTLRVRVLRCRQRAIARWTTLGGSQP